MWTSTGSPSTTTTSMSDFRPDPGLFGQADPGAGDPFGTDLVSRLAWVVAGGLDRSAEQRPGSDLGCALTMASPQGGGEDG